MVTQRYMSERESYIEVAQCNGADRSIVRMHDFLDAWFILLKQNSNLFCRYEPVMLYCAFECVFQRLTYGLILSESLCMLWRFSLKIIEGENETVLAGMPREARKKVE